MRKTWIFFKLRLLQLRYDKTALFFSYLLPVLLLTGIGYPLEMASKEAISVHYVDYAGNEASQALAEHLRGHQLLEPMDHSAEQIDVEAAIRAAEYDHFLVIESAGGMAASAADDDARFGNGALSVVLYSNSTNAHKIEAMAVGNVLQRYFGAVADSVVAEKYLNTDSITSYIVTLLPGLIGMTLLTIGLNGFGGVLIVESDGGLFKNIKTISASPAPFLAGLLLSRLIVCYSVAAALYLVGVFMFGLAPSVSFPLLFLAVTLGCVAFLGIGLIIAVHSESVSAFNGIVNFVNIPFIVFGGVFFSTAAFPQWLQVVSQVIPLTHMNQAVGAILFDQIGVLEIGKIAKELAILGVWCLVTLTIGLKKFKW